MKSPKSVTGSDFDEFFIFFRPRDLVRRVLSPGDLPGPKSLLLGPEIGCFGRVFRTQPLADPTP